MCPYVRMYVYNSVCTYVRKSVRMYVHNSVCTYVRKSVCTYVHMYICVFVMRPSGRITGVDHLFEMPTAKPEVCYQKIHSLFLP